MITDLKKVLVTFFEECYLKKINFIVEKYGVSFYPYQFIKFHEKELAEYSRIEIIHISEIATICSTEIWEMFKEIKIKNAITKKDETLAEILTSRFESFIKDAKKLIREFYNVSRYSKNNMLLSPKPINENKPKTELLKNNRIKFNADIYEIDLEPIYYTECGYFSIMENNGDDGTFFTVFITDL